MLKLKNHFSFPFSLLLLASTGFFASAANAGAGIGVDIYCVMRQGGNSHDSSWRAAYQSIKSQKQGVFKTSPKQAATMIVEAVVRNPDKFDECVSFLGDLYPVGGEDLTKQYAPNTEKTNPQINPKDRYSY